MFTLPKTLKIGGFVWTITSSQQTADAASAYGHTFCGKQVINIEPNTPDQLKEQTLLHEIMHAVWWQTGLWEMYRNKDKYMEEHIVATLSQGLYQVLKDNNIFKKNEKRRQ